MSASQRESFEVSDIPMENCDLHTIYVSLVETRYHRFEESCSRSSRSSHGLRSIEREEIQNLKPQFPYNTTVHRSFTFL